MTPAEFTELTLGGSDVTSEKAWREVMIQLISLNQPKVVEVLKDGWRVDTEEYKVVITLKE
jgi:hypothetical protein